MEGYNGTIFAYGQTSSGKTYTMEGPDLEDDKLKGIVPRMMDRIFQYIMNADEKLEFTVKVSFLEIYLEKVNDLLDVTRRNLKIKETKTRGPYIQGATEMYITGPDHMKLVLKTGASNRAVASTTMNQVSSRSHSIFIVQISQKNLTTENVKLSTLYCVDLAGSEKVGKTNVTGK